MPNTLKVIQTIARESLDLLENNLIMGTLVYRPYDAELKQKVNGYNQGDTISIRKPNKYITTDGTSGVDITSSIQDTIEGTTSVTLNRKRLVPLQFTMDELTLKIPTMDSARAEFSKRFLEPAIAALAQDVETDLCGLYRKVWNFAGTAGTVPSTVQHMMAPRRVLNEGAVPMDNRKAVLNPNSYLSLASAFPGFFSDKKATTVLEQAKIGNYVGFETYEAQSIATHTVGAIGSSSLTVNANVTASTYTDVRDTNTSTIAIAGFANSTNNVLREGDVFTVANVFSVNPMTKASTGRLQTFVVRANANSNGSGVATVSVSPAVITSGAYQTVTAAPASTAAVTVLTGAAGAQRGQNMFFRPDAFTLVMAPLAQPMAIDNAVTLTDRGMSIRVVPFYNGATDIETYRIEVLYGVEAIYPEQACRLTD